MPKRLLHITNGDFLTHKLDELNIEGDRIVWREMLNVGPTVAEVGSEEFFGTRSKFLEENYKIPIEKYEEDFVEEIKKLSTINNYKEVVLWFEFDLFCHLNMLATISFLLQNGKKVPVSLVCSQKLKGETEVLPLSKLSNKQLEVHFKNKIQLTQEDLELANHIWQIYCSSEHERLTFELKKTSNFEYLSSCIKAHLERFPHADSGLNTLEQNALKLINKHEIASEQQLLGYALEYQGYYGYLEPQIKKTLEKLHSFYTLEKDKMVLNKKGKQALEASHNFYNELKDDELFGGTKKYDFLYDPESHKLLKL